MKRETARGGSSARNIKRRTFIKAGAAVVAGAATLPGAVLAAEPAATVVVVHGTDIAKMVEAGIAKMGGWDKFFKPGKKVALKPNLAWNSTPEQGGNTHPDILRAVVLAAEARSHGGTDTSPPSRINRWPAREKAMDALRRGCVRHRAAVSRNISAFSSLPMVRTPLCLPSRTPVLVQDVEQISLRPC